MLSSHSVVSSSRTVRPCNPWGGRWIGQWRTTWSTVCSATHSQATEEAIPHLFKQERKRPIPVRRLFIRTPALLERVIPGGCVPVSGIKVRSIVELSAHSAFHWWSTHCATRMLLLSEKLMSCCAAIQMGVSIGGAVQLHPMDGWALSGAGVQAPWHGVLGIVWLLCDEAQQVGCLRGRLSAGVGRRHPVTIRKASLMVGSIKRVWALRHHTGAQYSAVEWTRTRVAVRNVVAPAP